MIGPWLRGLDYTQRRREMDEARYDYGCRATRQESSCRASLAQAGVDARMPVVIRVILSVNAEQVIMERVVSVGVAVVAGLVNHAVVDIDAWRPEK